MNDTLQLHLEGQVPLELFSKAVSDFNKVVDALTEEVVGEEKFKWEVSYLRAGSATIVVRPLTQDIDLAERTVRAYDELGHAIATHEPVPFSASVANPAYRLTKIINGYITSVTFGSDQNQHTVSAYKSKQSVERQSDWDVSWGSVSGDVGAIAKRPKLQLTVYDSLFDKAVGCSLPDNFASRINTLWNKQVTVIGRVYRHPDSGRPVRVRDVIDIQISEPIDPFAYLAARGIVDTSPDFLPETRIRQFRDAIKA